MSSVLVDARQVRAHLQHLARDYGLGQHAIAAAAELSQSTISLVSRRKVESVTRAVADALLGLTGPQIMMIDDPGINLPLVGTKRRLGALLAAGHSHAAIEELMPTANPRHLARNLNSNAQASAVAEVRVAYAVLSETQGSSVHARRRALAAGHRPPEWWAGLDMDRVRARPTEPGAGPPLNFEAFVFEVESLRAGGARLPRLAKHFGIREASILRRLERGGRIHLAHELARELVSA